MKTYEIYWNDLTDDAKRKLSGLNHENVELTPIAIVENMDEDEDEDGEYPEAHIGYSHACGCKD